MGSARDERDLPRGNNARCIAGGKDVSHQNRAPESSGHAARLSRRVSRDSLRTDKFSKGKKGLKVVDPANVDDLGAWEFPDQLRDDRIAIHRLEIDHVQLTIFIGKLLDLGSQPFRR